MMNREEAGGWRRKVIALALAPLLSAATDDRGVPFNPSHDPAFGDARGAIRSFLASAISRPRSPQHFCAIGYRSGASRSAWVHWREGRMLILWEPAVDRAYAADDLVDSRRQLNLDRDMVPTPADRGSSTYLIDRPWLDRTLADCRIHGARYSVNPPSRPRAGGD